MQYILSEDEYKQLKAAASLGSRFHDKTAVPLTTTQLQQLCTEIADTMPIECSWRSTNKPKPWGCIITAEKNGREWYCDECPVLKLCPQQHKEFSK